MLQPFTRILLYALMLSFGFSASAYETDTHYYATYKMARAAGFNHETANTLALGSQWVDEGFSSTPMGALVYGSMLRRIWHFPQYRFQKRRVTQDGHGTMSAITIAEFDHPVAYKLFDEGLKEANWFKIGLAIHVVQDTAGHSGFTAEAGHAEFGHHPDRTWLYTAKFKRMTGLIFRMLVALRELAPDESLDPAGIEARNQPLTSTTFKELENKHWLEIQETTARNLFKDPRYTPRVVNYMLRLARAKGYLNPFFNVEAAMPGAEDYFLSPTEILNAESKYRVDYGDGTPDYIDPWNRTRRDAHDVLRRWVAQRRAQEVSEGRFIVHSDFSMKMLDYFGMKGLREKLMAIESDPNLTLEQKIAHHDRLITPEMRARMIKNVVKMITSGEIPMEFDDETHVEFENDDGPRSLELKLKINDQREWIAKKYGLNLEFIPDTVAHRYMLRKQVQKEEEVRALDPHVDLYLTAPTPEILRDTQTEIVTFNKKQQWGIFFVKHGHNFRTMFLTWKDILTKGKAGIRKHARVKEFQVIELLEDKIRDGKYVYFGPVDQMSLLGRSKCEASLTESYSLGDEIDFKP